MAPHRSSAAAPYVAVVGPSDADPTTYETARTVGRLLAGRGAVVVCGGMGGVMEAAARGACEEGGASLGLLPGTDRGMANGYLTMAVATGLGELRNGLVVRASDAVVAVGGSWGTMSEIALARTLGLPTVSVGGWSPADSTGLVPTGLTTAASAGEAVDVVLGLLS